MRVCKYSTLEIALVYRLREDHPDVDPTYCIVVAALAHVGFAEPTVGYATLLSFFLDSF